MPVTINASTSSGLVQSADTSGQIELQTNGTTVATVNTSNNVQFRSSISVGNATPSTSGAGITFPATQSASTDANTLDDYEEGSWTPIVTSGTGSITSYTSKGSYTKVGNVVTVMGYVNLTNVGTAGANMQFTNLPFTVGYGGDGQVQPATPCRESNSTGTIYFAYTGGGTTAVTFQTSTAGAIAWVNNYKYSFVLTYQVA